MTLEHIRGPVADHHYSPPQSAVRKRSTPGWGLYTLAEEEHLQPDGHNPMEHQSSEHAPAVTHRGSRTGTSGLVNPAPATRGGHGATLLVRVPCLTARAPVGSVWEVHHSRMPLVAARRTILRPLGDENDLLSFPSRAGRVGRTTRTTSRNWADLQICPDASSSWQEQ